MQKIITYLILFLLLSSCLTERKIKRICNTCPLRSERRDSIVFKTETVSVYMPGAPGPTLYLENPCKLLCDSLGRLRPATFTRNKNGQTLSIRTMSGGLFIGTATRDTAKKVPITHKEVYSSSSTDNVRFIPCQNERTAFDGWCRIWFYITAPLLAGAAVLRKIKRLRPP